MQTPTSEYTMPEPGAPSYANHAADYENATHPNTPTAPLEKQRSPIYQLAQAYGNFVFSALKGRSQEERMMPWVCCIVVAALFNIQIRIKDTTEKGRDGKVRRTFFVSNGMPRPMSSFKLPDDMGSLFYNLPEKFRLLMARSFVENKTLLGVETPFNNFHDENERVQAMQAAEAIVTQLAQQ